MRILVTGGAGFIGSHVTDHLITAGHEVVVVDDLSTGKRENVNPRAQFHHMDICGMDYHCLDGVDAVCHLAAQSSVTVSVENPWWDARVNVQGTVNLLEGCRHNGVRRFVFASSGGAVYGDPTYLPADEQTPTRPLSPYGAAKLAVEHYLDVYRQSFGMETVALRLPNVYGPRQDPAGPAGVVARFAALALLDGTVVVNGDGQQTRDYVYIGDIARAFLLALERGSGVYCLGSETGRSVTEVLAGLGDVLGRPIPHAHAAALPGEVRHICLSHNRACRDLDWYPTIPWQDGPVWTVRWLEGTEHWRAVVRERMKKGERP